MVTDAAACEGDFAERPLYLPHCYLPGDRHRPSAAPPARAECGLPSDAFVYCSFNASYKITRDMFARWMRILARVPRAILWLLEPPTGAADNLRGEAERAGIDPARLVFAARCLPLHMARHALADLFLDTLPCNAHTTSNDALYAGLPVLTCPGETFASRVSEASCGHLRCRSSWRPTSKPMKRSPSISRWIPIACAT